MDTEGQLLARAPCGRHAQVSGNCWQPRRKVLVRTWADAVLSRRPVEEAAERWSLLSDQERTREKGPEQPTNHPGPEGAAGHGGHGRVRQQAQRRAVCTRDRVWPGCGQ